MEITVRHSALNRAPFTVSIIIPKLLLRRSNPAILLAGLYADDTTAVTEPVLSRNHTELMLTGFGANIASETHADGTATASITPCEELYAQKIQVPGDISSAAYFIAAGLLVPGSEILVKNVGINPTRAGILKVCEAMGADITYLNETSAGGEPTADLLVRYSPLKATVVEGSIIPTLIDEIPMIAIMAAFAEGTTIIRDAAELKVQRDQPHRHRSPKPPGQWAAPSLRPMTV